tara:strand:+ start:3452 stop:4738 length:1287 start_codon:yes stop_codon:yes gene_type:complete
MTVKYIKKAIKTAETDDLRTQSEVIEILNKIKNGKEKVIRELNKKYDKYDGEIIVSEEIIEEAKKKTNQNIKDDIKFAHERIKKFSEHQLKSMNNNFEIELSKGLYAGQKLVPIETVGCYVPGGRFPHISSAIMGITPAKVAGVKNIICASPPKDINGANAGIIFAANYCGADVIMNLGGVAAVGSLTHGFFGNKPVDFLVGAGNQYVAEAKRIVFGKVGIDQFAGPTEIAIIADKTSDKEIVAADIVGQIEHGYNSPAWLITSDKSLADFVSKRVPELIKELPKLSKENAEKAWKDYGEIILCESREEMLETSDKYASEHLEVHAENLNWWLENLKNYGSLFLGEETTVAYGDYCSGTNHILPTKGAGRYTGGLFVGKFLKTLTFQRMTKDATKTIGPNAARLGRAEGMEGHARTCDVRLRKYGFSN